MITAKKKENAILAVLLSFAVFLAIAALSLIMLEDAEATSRSEALRAMEESIIRAAVSAYAYEGVYPENIDYLEENYNLVINKDRYTVYYSRIGDNIMPNIIVTERIRY